MGAPVFAIYEEATGRLVSVGSVLDRAPGGGVILRTGLAVVEFDSDAIPLDPRARALRGIVWSPQGRRFVPGGEPNPLVWPQTLADALAGLRSRLDDIRANLPPQAAAGGP